MKSKTSMIKSKGAKLPKAKKDRLKGSQKKTKSDLNKSNLKEISDKKRKFLITDNEDEYDSEILGSDDLDSEEEFVGGASDEYDEDPTHKKIEEDEEDDSDEELENDDSDIELKTDLAASKKDNIVTSSLIHQLEKNFLNNVNLLTTFKCLQQVLAAALNSICDQGKNREGTPSIYVIQDSLMFNAVIRLCLKYVPQTLYPIFHLKSLSDAPTKSRKNQSWFKPLRSFMVNFASLTGSVTEPDALVLILKKGILPLLPFYVLLPKIHTMLTRHLIALWGTGQEKVRVLSLMALFRLMQSLNENTKENILKQMYITYVSSCRFTSTSTWPVIDFMRCSLAELFTLNEILAYRHSFIFVRQLAIHLRNAMLDQSKQKVQLVYNWQFLHSLNLWAELMVKTHPSEILQPMIYPLTQICLGVIQLQNTPRYFPMTFHICRILTELSAKTQTFIPVLPHIMQILSCPALYQSPSKTSSKPLPWDCIIKLSEPQIKNALFIDGVIDQVFNSTLTYLNTVCCSIAFPELVIPLRIELQSFKKKSKSLEHRKKIVQLLNKIVENSEFIESRRREVSFGISAGESIKNWEIEVEQTQPPLRAFFLQWKKMLDELNRMEKLNVVNQCNLSQFTVNTVRKRFLENESTWKKTEEERKKSLLSYANYAKEKDPQTNPKVSKGQNDAEKQDEDELTEMKWSDLENSDSENMDAQNDTHSADEKDSEDDNTDDEEEEDMYDSDEEEEE